MQQLEARVRTLEAKVADLEDRSAIQNLRFRYHVAINDGGHESIGALFSEDAEVDFGEIGMARGRSDIEELYRRVVGGSPFIKQFIHNHVITLRGDTASGLSYLDARTVTNGESILVAGRFDDEYVREPDTWRFRRLRLTLYFAVPVREGWADPVRLDVPRQAD